MAKRLENYCIITRTNCSGEIIFKRPTRDYWVLKETKTYCLRLLLHGEITIGFTQNFQKIYHCENSFTGIQGS